MKRVGITGGIGCGKSTVVAEFQKLGVSAFVADKVGAQCYNDPVFLAQVRTLFGPEVFASDGTVDKRRIASKVFANRHLLAELNSLVHPRVMQAFDQFCLLHASEPYILFESAILYDSRLDKMMDTVLCVHLQLEERIRRLLLRDQTTRDQILARISNQLPANEIMRRADLVILNYEGNPRSRQVAYFDKILRQ